MPQTTSTGASLLPTGSAGVAVTHCTVSSGDALIDFDALHVGGMPAYEQALRTMQAHCLELADRLAWTGAQS